MNAIVIAMPMLEGSSTSVAPGAWRADAACLAWSHLEQPCPVCGGDGCIRVDQAMPLATWEAAGLDPAEPVPCPWCELTGTDLAWFAIPDPQDWWHDLVVTARREVCQGCPVRRDCRAYTAAIPQACRPPGVQAGRMWTDADRGGPAPVVPPVCGEVRMYRTGCRCEPCREAKRKSRNPQ